MSSKRKQQALKVMRDWLDWVEQEEAEPLMLVLVAEFIDPEDMPQARAGEPVRFSVGTCVWPDLSQDETVQLLEEGIDRVQQDQGETVIHEVKSVH